MYAVAVNFLCGIDYHINILQTRINKGRSKVMKTYFAGIDVGSTTVKLVVFDEQNSILFGEYMRHMAHTQETLATLLKNARDKSEIAISTSESQAQAP